MKSIFLSPLAVLYGIAICLRNKLFDLGILKSCQFDIPIICVGNITVGGTGKTPHTEALISMLRKNYSVACISRGYKRKSSGFIIVNEESTSEKVGDEPLQIKRKFPDIIVAVDGNRRRAINKLMQHSEKPDVIILDDGFQHRYVKADINILLMDYNRPIYDDHLLPWGELREKPRAIDRAAYIIITKCPHNITPLDKRIMSKHLRPKAYQELLFSTMRYGEPKSLDGVSSCHLSSNTSILCVTGIAQPSPYIKYLKTISGSVTYLTYPDHYQYKNSDIKKIIDLFKSIDNPYKYIFTTEKDAMRLERASFPKEIRESIFYIPIEAEFLTSQKQLNKNINDYVKQDNRKQ